MVHNNLKWRNIIDVLSWSNPIELLKVVSQLSVLFDCLNNDCRSPNKKKNNDYRCIPNSVLPMSQGAWSPQPRSLMRGRVPTPWYQFPVSTMFAVANIAGVGVSVTKFGGQWKIASHQFHRILKKSENIIENQENSAEMQLTYERNRKILEIRNSVELTELSAEFADNLAEFFENSANEYRPV
jgi:hypothetical protein